MIDAYCLTPAKVGKVLVCLCVSVMQTFEFLFDDSLVIAVGTIYGAAATVIKAS